MASLPKYEMFEISHDKKLIMEFKSNTCDKQIKSDNSVN